MRNNCGENACIAAAWFCMWALCSGTFIGIAAIVGAMVGSWLLQIILNYSQELIQGLPYLIG